MDNTSIGEMSLEQIPKELRPNKYEHKSPWAFIIIFIVAILFGIFYFVETKDQVSVVVPVVNEQTPAQDSPISESPELTNDLEASVGSIDIPSYSEEL